MLDYGSSFWRSQNGNGTEFSELQSPYNERGLPLSKFKSKETWIGVTCVAFISVSYLVLVSTPTALYGAGAVLPLQIRNFFGMGGDEVKHQTPIEEVFAKAALPNRTIILTALNAAWAEKDSMIDLFLESLRSGDGTPELLKHLVIVSLDQKAHNRCEEIHHLCLKIKTGGVNYTGEQAFLSADYIKMIWRRIKFLNTVLNMNYNFVFTDADILWFRNPFPLLLKSNADFQIACDQYNGRPEDVNNIPNAGFVFVRANNRTRTFYKYWYRERNRVSRGADQEVFNEIKHEKKFAAIGMKVRFWDTQFLGGFCALGTTDMSKAVTMHATCCKGLDAKLADLRMLLGRWRQWKEKGGNTTFPAVTACPRSWP